jgi:2-hydroxycyclohexanecarboxyl-CoA dehydrogenase
MTGAEVRRFEDRIAVVTGAAGGIGRAICTRLATEGAHVVACDLDEGAVAAIVEDLRADDLVAEPLAFDLADGGSCHAAMADVLERHGRVDVLVNNAGINRRGDVLTISEDDWAATFAVNVDAMVHLCRAVLPSMAAAGGGSIVNTASQWGLYPAPGHVAYNVSKAAVVALTRNLARDHAPQGIRVNAVCPGEIHTPMLEAGLARSGRTVADLDALVPFGRIGRPEEVAALVAFLACDEVPFLCGAVVELTGAQAVA